VTDVDFPNDDNITWAMSAGLSCWVGTRPDFPLEAGTVVYADGNPSASSVRRFP
jgi:hypothetical protein